MIQEKTLTICDKDVKVRYCLASETGYELLSGKDINTFLPVPTDHFDEAGKVIFGPAKATTDDFIRLSFACIMAAYECEGKEPPVTVKDIMYNATPQEITNLIASCVELRIKWYEAPKVVQPETEEQDKEDDGKNG